MLNSSAALRILSKVPCGRFRPKPFGLKTVGVYSYTVTGNEDVEVYAEFELLPAEPVKSCKGSLSGASLLGMLLLPAAYFVAKKSRKED